MFRIANRKYSTPIFWTGETWTKKETQAKQFPALWQAEKELEMLNAESIAVIPDRAVESIVG